MENYVKIKSRKNEDRVGNKEEKINSLVNRINDAVNSGFSGTISFEVNFNQGGIRTIKSNVEEFIKF